MIVEDADGDVLVEQVVVEEVIEEEVVVEVDDSISFTDVIMDTPRTSEPDAVTEPINLPEN